jgi:hypothetical protein
MRRVPSSLRSSGQTTRRRSAHSPATHAQRDAEIAMIDPPDVAAAAHPNDNF